MRMHRRMVKITFATLALSALLFSGCTKRPDQDQLNRLEEARAAAESAETKLAAKKKERKVLEAQLATQQKELSVQTEERDELKEKMATEN